MRSLFLKSLRLSCLALSILAANSASAVTYLWTGGSSPSSPRWGSPTNWSPASTTDGPKPFDTAIFNSVGATNLTVLMRPASGTQGVSVDNLVFNSDADANVTLQINGAGSANFGLRGDITIDAGSAGAHSIVATAASDSLTFGSTSAQLIRNWTNESAQTFTINAAILRSGAAGNTQLNIGGAGSWNLMGPISGGAGSNTLRINKSGAGTLILGGDNTFVAQSGGGVEVTGGTLSVENITGSATSTGLVNIGTGGALAGNGSISGATTVSGLLTPGTGSDATSILTIANTLTLTSTAAVNMTIASTAAGGFDQVTGMTTFALAGALTFNITSSILNGDEWDLFNFTAKTGNFDSVVLSGLYTGSLVRTGDLWEYTDGITDWEFSQASGILSVAVVPEPSTLALSALGLGLLLARRRKDLLQA